VITQATQPSNGAYTPGDTISVTFNEEVDCIRPYKFSASLLIAAPTPVTVVPSMFCVLNKIELQIPASVVVCWLLQFYSDIGFVGDSYVFRNISVKIILL
jgi:hypothetical protein